MIDEPKGFSLIEVVVAVGLVALVFLGIGTLFATAQRNITQHGDYRQALEIAQSEIEALAKIPPGNSKLRITDPSGVEIAGGSLLDSRNATGQITLLGKAYAWSSTCNGLLTLPGSPCTGLYRRIEWVNDPNFDLDGTGKDYKKVTIVLAWPDPLSPSDAPRMNRIDLETFVAK